MMQDNSDFYRKLDFLPTETSISPEDSRTLSAYERNRKQLFEYCLRIPMATLRDRSYLEIGPDSGENALVAALSGAKVTLIDRNPRAIEKSVSNFTNFGLQKNLIYYEVSDFQEFRSDQGFNFVAAEGFIHSIVNKDRLLSSLRNLVSIDGFLLVSYYDTYSCFGDLLHARLFQSLVKGVLGGNWVELDLEKVIQFGESVFRQKWESKPHSRTLRTWILDILLNPALDLKLTIDAEDLCEDMYLNGFELWGSWPNYDPRSLMRWHRLERNQENEIASILRYLRSRRLAHVFGIDLTLDLSDTMLECVRDLMIALNVCDWEKARYSVDKLQQSNTSTQGTYFDNSILSLQLNMISEIFNLMLKKEYGKVIELISGSTKQAKDIHLRFLNFWGQPNHFAAFKRLV